MASVTIQVGGRGYQIACRDGEEERVHQLASVLDQRWPAASRASGGSAERAFLFVALMLADSLDEAENRPPPTGLVSEAQLDNIAAKLERLAGALEQAAPGA
jgi:cell division protein ZapA